MGVLKCADHAEAGCDLSKLSGFNGMCYLATTTLDSLNVDSDTFESCYIQDIIKYRNQHETFIKHVDTQDIETQYGCFEKRCYHDILNNKYHYTLSVGGPFKESDTILVRIHSECLTGDAFGSLRCDCGPQLEAAMQLIQTHKKGVIVYMRQEGRGIGLLNKMKAYKLQETGKDTVEANLALGFGADLRDYGIGAQLLQHLNIRHIDLITNNPKKVIGLEGYAIQIEKRVPLIIEATAHNENYLKAKGKKLGHFFDNLKKVRPSITY